MSKRVKLTENFYLDEYIPKDLYLKWEKKSHILIGLLDKKLVTADQILRYKFGSALINTWWNGGDRHWSGIRTPDSKYYSDGSQHTYGNASDKIFLKTPIEDIRDYIKERWFEIGISCIEKNVSWLHSDTRYIIGQKELLIV